MAGKNQITSISNLSIMKKLDVLDLHSNEISEIQGLDSLRELRVLNLAGKFEIFAISVKMWDDVFRKFSVFFY